MNESTATQQMPETRRKVLELLKREGPMKADELGRALNITAMGVRQHLVALERDGLVAYTTEKQALGRPSYRYELTERGDELFPRSYPQLANNLLEAARVAFGDEGVDAIFSARNDQLASVYEGRCAGKALAGKVAELAALRTEEGYMADWERQDDDTFLLREHNCAICQVAKRCMRACTFELELFQRTLPEAEVTRQTHIMQGARTCTYVIRRRG